MRRFVALLIPLALATLAPPAPAQPRAGTIIGIVTDTTGVPLGGAEVVLLEQQRGMRTGDNGLFRLERVPPGPNVVFVRRLAFHEITAFVHVAAGDTTEVTFEMQILAHELAPVIVAASRRKSRRLAEFEARRRMGFGEFFTREDIEKLNVLYLSDVLRRVPGVRVVLNDKGRYVVHIGRALGFSLRKRPGPCSPSVFLDGILYPAMEDFGIDAFLISDLEAIEVYRGVAEVPPQYAGTGSGCGVILLWTRVGG